MGCCQSKSKVKPIVASCPECHKTYDSSVIANIGTELYEHIATAHCPEQGSIECVLCDSKVFCKPSQGYIDHLRKEHNFAAQLENGSVGGHDITITCPECSKTFESKSAEDLGCNLYDHISSLHISDQITCSLCGEAVKSTDYISHLRENHEFVNRNEVREDALLVTSSQAATLNNAPQPTREGRPIPKPGDKVLCKWGKWQYFDSTILSFDENKLEYYIEWDDQDPSDRHVSIEHLAVNQSPYEDEIGIGSMVLFHQGGYCASAEVGRLAGVRWHQGKITSITTAADGTKLYSGTHSKSASDGKWVTYKGYEPTFSNYKLEELRCAPNLFDILEQNVSQQNQEMSFNTKCDVYLSYCPSDSLVDVKAGLAKSPNKTRNYENMNDPLTIKKELESLGYKVLSNIRNGHNRELDLNKIVSCIKNCSMFICCISDDYAVNDNCRMEMQYAKKTAHKPSIPIIVGDGGWDWQATVVGMLIAGERYIDFKTRDLFDEKFEDLRIQVGNIAGKDKPSGTAESGEQQVTTPESNKKDIFVSYCWNNSSLSEENNEIPKLFGSQWNDPRKIKSLLSEKYNVWLDIEQLTSGQASGMFEQMTTGLINSKVVLAFISSEYAKSDNCKMEFQFAAKSLRKPFIPICVGEDMGWRESVIGALVMGSGVPTIDMLEISGESHLEKKMEEIFERLSEHIQPTQDSDSLGEVQPDSPPPDYQSAIKSRAPRVGDHVISFHFRHAYYTSTILSFNKEDMTYYIKWDDGDPSGRNPKYNQVGLNIDPDDDDIGVGSSVFFPQGSYGGTEGNNTGGLRYHEGIVESVVERAGVKYFSGHHLRGDEDGKWVTYRGYEYSFSDMTVTQLRIAPNAMDALFNNFHGLKTDQSN
ncbi:uncharacterized protein LOC134820532 isoform X1 [Bolinopsis microptera]|uniref:uncharacterized protein LOC134820532 isoform X1 n=1 Tax=Bolinopsis microptera TaxID=2820187 RepID=UPI003078D8A9